LAFRIAKGNLIGRIDVLKNLQPLRE